jgi:iron complex outermembrane receptor protein
VTSDILAYAKTSRGFKAGAENQRGSVIGTPFGPEIVTDYEIGLKSEWFDHKLRVNAAAYHSDYDGIQRDILALIDNQIVTVVRNAASATIDGVEFEITAKPVDGLTLQATSAYTHPQYVKYTDPATGQDLSGNKFLDTPAWQIGLSGTYVIPTSVGPLSTTVDYSYESTLYLYPESHSAYTGNSTTQNGYSLVNARLSLDVPAVDGTAAIWVKNIFDERYNTTGNDFTGGPGAVGYVLTYPGNPRTFGVEFTKRF